MICVPHQILLLLLAVLWLEGPI